MRGRAIVLATLAAGRAREGKVRVYEDVHVNHSVWMEAELQLCLARRIQGSRRLHPKKDGAPAFLYAFFNHQANKTATVRRAYLSVGTTGRCREHRRHRHRAPGYVNRVRATSKDAVGSSDGRKSDEEMNTYGGL